MVEPVPFPRYWKATIARITGLDFCDRECPCGANNQLWWSPTPSADAVPGRVPGWMNGGDSHDIWRWLCANGTFTRPRRPARRRLEYEFAARRPVRRHGEEVTDG